MTNSLAELAERAGIESAYISESGEHRVIPDDVKVALLDAMELDAASQAPAEPAMRRHDAPSACFIPEWLQRGRAWGISVQLYGVRSRRNAGIGDFEDLAQLAEMFSAWGADFVGVNPLHALFSADPERASPYSPSSRRYLNPNYIAVDRFVREADVAAYEARLNALRKAELVDYAGVAALKRAVLAAAFAHRADEAAFAAFCDKEGEALHRFAIFEALGEHFSSQGLGAGWHGWPEMMRDPGSADVAEFAELNGDRVRFHKWLQWICAKQLEDAQRRALAAGMRIGIYLDLAVGVSPDGAAAWSDRALFATRARIGAPPDLFNHLGQDWGLAPMKPAMLAARSLAPFESEVSGAMDVAGAVRLDHVMGLRRLYWVPAGTGARGGGYVRYPLGALLEVLASCSQAKRCIVIGEDLGTVPPDFRGRMRQHAILGYRVFYFERGHEGRFNAPQDYPAEALACIATHDLPPLRGWWAERDIDARVVCGIYDSAEAAAAARTDRTRDRARMIDALRASGVLDDAGEINLGTAPLPEDVLVAAHLYVARTPSWLVALQLEDLAGAIDMVNLPGTDQQHANWRRKLPVLLEELPTLETLRKTVEAVASERPRQ